MFEDSYLDSFMESHIGGWNGDEDSYDDENPDCSVYDWGGDPNQDEDSLMEENEDQENYVNEE